jgi:hypothetical protein
MTTRRDFLKTAVAAPVLPAVVAATPPPESAPAPVSDERVRKLVDRLHQGTDDPDQAAVNALYSKIVHSVRTLLEDVREARELDRLPEGFFHDKDGDDNEAAEDLADDLQGLEYNLRAANDFIPAHLAFSVLYPKNCRCAECRDYHDRTRRYVKEALE